MTTSSVPNFLEDDEDETGVALQPGTIQQPEDSVEPESKTAESVGIGADRTSGSATIGADSQTKATDFNPVLGGDDEEYEGEQKALAAREPRVSITRPAAQATISAPEQADSVSVEVDGSVGAGAERVAKKLKRKMNPSAPKYGRTHMKEKDFLVMAFLRKFGFATSKQLSIVLGVAVGTAHRRSLGLREVGLVGSDKIFGATQLWFLTAKGYDVLDFHHLYDDRIAKRFHPGKGVPTKLEHTLAVIHVAAQLVGGVSELRFVPGVELASGLDLLPALVPEGYMNSEYSRATTVKRGESEATKKKPAEVAFEHQKTIAQWIREKKITKTEALDQYPFLWTVVNHPAARESKKVKESHPADLVLDLSVLGEDWSGIKRIAIEVELSAKQAPELRKIIRSFHMNYTSTYVDVFDYVAYISHKESIKEAVDAAAETVIGGTGAGSYVGTFDLKDSDGKIFNGKAWTL
jgi:hypothetical protein